MDDTFIDGCGVFPDVPIGEGTRIRIWLDEDRQQDLSIFVADGVLHVLGQYRPLIVTSIEANHIGVTTEKWPTKEQA